MKIIKKAGLIILLVVVLFCTWQCNMIIYGIRQGVGQYRILKNAKSLSYYLENDTFPEVYKEKIRLIQDIRQFGIDSLGLVDNDNYKKMYDQKGNPVLWVVTACPPFELNPFTWDYPFLGEMSYKGFFKYNLAKEEEESLKDKGLDTDIDEVNAWSTLGWFDDPILSKMLDRSEGELARLIIHELTHTTVFVKGDTRKSENLATFIGDNGAYYYLERKYGSNSKEYRDYEGKIEDLKKFGDHVLRGARNLDSLYSSWNDAIPKEKRVALKYDMINRIVHDLDTLTLYKGGRFNRFIKRETMPNNTFFASFSVYREQQSDLKDQLEYQFKGDFKAFVNHLKEEYN